MELLVIERKRQQPPRINRREVCELHGWVGTAVFERDRHDLCAELVEGAPCKRCRGKRFVTAKECTRCHGTGVEPELIEVALDPADVAPRVKTQRKDNSRRARGVPRSRSISVKNLTRQELREGAALYPPVDVARPKTRGECRDGERPCPWAGCRHHLYLDINPETGSIKINFPATEPTDLAETCSLDVAERTALTLDAVGLLMNITRERTRQIEVRGLLAIRTAQVIAESEDVA